MSARIDKALCRGQPLCGRCALPVDEAFVDRKLVVHESVGWAQARRKHTFKRAWPFREGAKPARYSPELFLSECNAAHELMKANVRVVGRRSRPTRTTGYAARHASPVDSLNALCTRRRQLNQWRERTHGRICDKKSNDEKRRDQCVWRGRGSYQPKRKECNLGDHRAHHPRRAKACLAVVAFCRPERRGQPDPNFRQAM